MGTFPSKEEKLYQAVEASNHQAVKTLRRDGASLEWRDKEGRTPLILACTRGDLYDMVITLLNEGAKLDAYRSGQHGGYPLHHAAKKGLDKTVLLLLSRGANPLDINDDGLTPLDMARNRSHASVVRIIEERICLFSGTVREMSGPDFFLVPQWLVTKKIWVVVLPTKSDPRNGPRNELVIYQNQKVPIPRTVISLSKAEVEEPKWSLPDPALVVTATDRTAKVKFKFLAENDGDKSQLEKFYLACARGTRLIENGLVAPPGISPSRGQLQPSPRTPAPHSAGPKTPCSAPASAGLVASPSPVTPTPQAKPNGLVPPSEDPTHDEIALAMAIKNSILSASAEGVPVSPSANLSSSWDGGRNKKGERSEFGGWVEGEQGSYGGWGPSSSAGAGPSRLAPSSSEENPSPQANHGASKQPLPALPYPTSSGMTSIQPESATASPSAPPVPSAPPLHLDGPIHYPSIDTSPLQVSYTPVAGDALALEGTPSSEKKAASDEKVGSGQCVVCWDAAAQAVCIPCGHLAGCMDCLTEIKSKDWGCPVCRAQIQQVVKVYAV